MNYFKKRYFANKEKLFEVSYLQITDQIDKLKIITY